MKANDLPKFRERLSAGSRGFKPLVPSKAGDKSATKEVATQNSRTNNIQAEENTGEIVIEEPVDVSSETENKSSYNVDSPYINNRDKLAIEARLILGSLHMLRVQLESNTSIDSKEALETIKEAENDALIVLDDASRDVVLDECLYLRQQLGLPVNASIEESEDEQDPYEDWTRDDLLQSLMTCHERLENLRHIREVPKYWTYSELDLKKSLKWLQRDITTLEQGGEISGANYLPIKESATTHVIVTTAPPTTPPAVKTDQEETALATIDDSDVIEAKPVRAVWVDKASAKYMNDPLELISDNRAYKTVRPSTELRLANDKAFERLINPMAVRLGIEEPRYITVDWVETRGLLGLVTSTIKHAFVGGTPVDPIIAQYGALNGIVPRIKKWAFNTYPKQYKKLEIPDHLADLDVQRKPTLGLIVYAVIAGAIFPALVYYGGKFFFEFLIAENPVGIFVTGLILLGVLTVSISGQIWGVKRLGYVKLWKAIIGAVSFDGLMLFSEFMVAFSQDSGHTHEYKNVTIALACVNWAIHSYYIYQASSALAAWTKLSKEEQMASQTGHKPTSLATQFWSNTFVDGSPTMAWGELLKLLKDKENQNDIELTRFVPVGTNFNTLFALYKGEFRHMAYVLNDLRINKDPGELYLYEGTAGALQPLKL